MPINPATMKLGLALCLGSALCLSSVEAEAITLQPLVDAGPRPDVTLVIGGCGVGFHRGPAGACRANGVAVVGTGVVTGARVGVAGVTQAGVDRRVSRRTARRTSRRVARRHFY